MRIELICVGTELLAGRVNTHAAWLAGRLARVGLGLNRETTVPDHAAAIGEAVSAALRRADLVITTGGLGPTFDDLTRPAVARVLGRQLRLDRDILSQIESRFTRRGMRMPPSNRSQARVIEGARVLDNEVGTAPGLLARRGRKAVALLPGPLSELEPMVDRDLLPWLSSRTPGRAVAVRRMLILGHPESAVDEKIRPFVSGPRAPRGTSFTILSKPGQVELIVSAVARTGKAASALAEKSAASLEGLFGKDAVRLKSADDSLESVVGRMLKEQGLTLALAESCTGGGLAHRITNVPGTSDYFVEAVVAYANASKSARLGVPETILKSRGAVSRETALAMAAGVRSSSGASIGLAITGIAGPSGGTPEKPVGLVWFGVSGPNGVPDEAHESRFTGTRMDIKERAATRALDLLRRRLRRRP